MPCASLSATGHHKRSDQELTSYLLLIRGVRRPDKAIPRKNAINYNLWPRKGRYISGKMWKSVTKITHENGISFAPLNLENQARVVRRGVTRPISN